MKRRVKKSPRRRISPTNRRRSRKSKTTATEFFNSSVPTSPSLNLASPTPQTPPCQTPPCQKVPDPNRTTNQGCEPGFKREGNCCVELSQPQKQIVNVIQKARFEQTFNNWAKEQTFGPISGVITDQTQSSGEKIYILMLLESMKKIFISKFEAFQSFVSQLGDIIFTSGSNDEDVQKANEKSEQKIRELENDLTGKNINQPSVIEILKEKLIQLLQFLWDVSKKIVSQSLWIFWRLSKFLFNVGWSLGSWILSNPTTSRYLALIGLQLKNELCKQISIELGYFEVKSGVKLFVNDASELTQNAKTIIWQASISVASRFADSPAFNSMFELFGSIFSLPLSLLNAIPAAFPFFNILQRTFFSVLKETARESVKISMFQTEVSEAWRLIFEIFDVRNCIKPVQISQERADQRWINNLHRLSDEQYSVEWLKQQGVKIPEDEEAQKKFQEELNKAKEEAKNTPCPLTQKTQAQSQPISSTITDFVAAFKSFI